MYLEGAEGQIKELEVRLKSQEEEISRLRTRGVAGSMSPSAGLLSSLHVNFPPNTASDAGTYRVAGDA
jgi:hypothetical protein